MNYDQRELERKSGIPAHPERVTAVTSIASGVAIGALIGFFTFAGLPAVLAGAVFGAVASAGVLQFMRARWKRERETNEVLDREIGVIDGDIGAAPPRPPRTA